MRLSSRLISMRNEGQAGQNSKKTCGKEQLRAEIHRICDKRDPRHIQRDEQGRYCPYQQGGEDRKCGLKHGAYIKSYSEYRTVSAIKKRLMQAGQLFQLSRKIKKPQKTCFYLKRFNPLAPHVPPAGEGAPWRPHDGNPIEAPPRATRYPDEQKKPFKHGSRKI